ncbi:MAG: hypothetical protein Q8L71_03885 [Thiobacillus sp.]|nr:hypothetical protein [Thiobacillus sp.]MDP1997580.1 hypothetical protein [Gallionella sp.]
MVCYDLDRFREFLISKGFTELYDLPANEMAKLLTDDTELMLFGFRFLKQVLFGENTIAMHQETAAKRMERTQEKLQQLEAEAREKRAADADGMYEDEE